MPPKSARKTVAGPGTRRGGRAGRGTPRTPIKKVSSEEINVVVAASSEVKKQVQIEVVKKDEVIEEKPTEIIPIAPELAVAPQSEQVMKSITEIVSMEIASKEDAVLPLKKEDDIKESTDEYGKDERLDLDDNEPDYEPEECVGVDYDEKEIERDDVEGGGDEIDEEAERDVGDEEDGDMEEEEIEDQAEELEGEEEDDHVSEEQPDLVDGEEDHHDLFKERRKRKEFEIFVGGLDKEATEDDLRKVFKDVGEVTEVRLLMNPQTKKNKGFAFLRFATIEQAKRACTEIKNPVVNGKQCGVTPSQDSDTLILGNICRTWTKEALKSKLKHYGIDNIQDLTLVEDSNNEGTNRGFAFLEFYSRPVAMKAFKRLQKKDVLFGLDRPVKVSFADSFIDPGDEIMSQVKTVFIDGLLASWDEDRMRDLLKAYGIIEKIELARNMPSARRKDFGFVTFSTHDSAVICAKSINNEELGEGNNKIKVRARLSRPLHRGKGKHVIRDARPRRGSTRSGRAPWSRSIQRGPPPPARPGRIENRPRHPADRGLKRPISSRDRRPVASVSSRARPLPSPPRSYDRRPPPPPVPSYSKSSMKRDYGRREQPPPLRIRAAVDYGSRAMAERRQPHNKDDYPPRPSSGYTDLPRSSLRSSVKRPYVDDGYGQRYERPPPPPPPSYREGRDRDYDPVPGSKRPYSSLDDISPRYADSGVPHSRARLDYDLSGSSSHYVEAYGDRMGRSSLGYGGGGGSSRAPLSSHDSHGLYGSRHSMGGYSGGSYGGGGGGVNNNNVAGGMYSSSGGYGHDSDYIPRRSDVSVGGGSSYSSSMYSGRGLGGGGSSYMGGGSGSCSYY